MCDSKLANIWTILGFGVFLLLGIGIYQDYGISWDEVFHRYMGGVSAFYVNEIVGAVPVNEVLQYGNGLGHGFEKRPPSLEEFVYKDYGVFFEMLLVSGEYLFDLIDTRELFFFRHFFSFCIFFLGIVSFYFLIIRFLGSHVFALIGCTMLIVSPRIFAHGFYDIKDIAPVTLAITSIYTLIRLLDNKNIKTAVLHGLSVALFIDTRVIGIFFPAITVFFLGGEVLRSHIRREAGENITRVIWVFLGALAVFVYLFWPYLWEDPIRRLWGALTNMSQFGESDSGDWEILYLGSFISARNVPWHYLPVWIGITTPVIYLILMLVGTGSAVWDIVRRPANIFDSGRERISGIVLLTAYGPLVAVIVVNSTLLDGWRHMYFCYPAMIMLSVFGLWRLREWFTIKQVSKIRRVLWYGGLVSLLGSIGLTSVNMYQNHPHQYAYFNAFAGNNIDQKWELDYWGLSFRQGLEYVVGTDKRKEIKVGVSSFPGKQNPMILEEADRRRIKIVEEKNADYFLSNYRFKKEYERFHAGEAPYDREIFSVKVKTWLDEFKIMGVYKIQ